MGDIQDEQDKALATNTEEVAQPSSGPSGQKPDDKPIELSVNDPTTRVAVRDFVTTEPPSCAEASTGQANTIEPLILLPSPPDPVEDALEFGDCFGETDKGKGRADSTSALTREANRISTLEKLQYLHGAPEVFPPVPFGCRALPEDAGKNPNYRSLSSTDGCVIEAHNDYPHLDGPRTINRWEMMPSKPHRKLPEPQNMDHHDAVTSYAGESLYALCPSVPYVLGPLTLVKRMQLIVETPLLLPDQVIDLLIEKGIDISSLAGYDLAILNILGYLWND